MAPPDEEILHQSDVEEVIDERIEAAGVEDSGTYAVKTELEVVAPTAPGATYLQAEATSMKTAVDAIIAALVASGVLVEA